jgi:hypothetical protein
LNENQCSGNSAGIFIRNGARVEARRNICTQNFWSGIAVRDKGTQAVLSANQCNNNGAWGIISWEGADPDIREDNVTAGNGKADVKRRNKAEIACLSPDE